MYFMHICFLLSHYNIHTYVYTPNLVFSMRILCCAGCRNQIRTLKVLCIVLWESGFGCGTLCRRNPDWRLNNSYYVTNLTYDFIAINLLKFPFHLPGYIFGHFREFMKWKIVGEAKLLGNLSLTGPRLWNPFLRAILCAKSGTAGSEWIFT